MQDRPEAWTEAMVRQIEAGEHDFQEFKGRGFVVEGGKISSQFIALLSKQLSAFANASGGRLFLGVDDDGRIDGGVPMDLKGGGVRAWLEDIIPDAVEPTLRGFNVFEVRRSGPDSLIDEGCAVYVIDIPGSPEAPHMAGDRRYYLRIAGKSRPMGHVHIQDILRRTRHPEVQVARVGPYGKAEPDEGDPRGLRIFVCLQLFIANTGMRLARHVGVEIEVPRLLVSGAARERTLAAGDIQLTQRPGAYLFFRYHPTPVFPGQEIHYCRIWIGLHARNLDVLHDRAQIRCRVYADDAAPTVTTTELASFHLVRRAMKTIDNRVRIGRRKGRVVRREPGPDPTEDLPPAGED
ncbi:MAG: ATP-binding protein [bacterium]